MKNKSILTLLTMILAVTPFTSCSQNKQNNGKNMENKKTLIVFFSRTGENYGVGDINKGNTHIIAEMIAEQTNGTLFQVVPEKEYPHAYNDCVALAKQEKQSNARPAIKGDVAVEDYDVIYIGYPNWWADMPMPIYTFIEKHNWQNKTVIPFCTHEGSGLSNTEDYIKKACKGATVLQGLEVQGSIAQKSQDQARKTVQNWIANHSK